MKNSGIQENLQTTTVTKLNFQRWYILSVIQLNNGNAKQTAMEAESLL